MTIDLIELPYHPNTILKLFESLSCIEWSMLLYSGHNNTNSEKRFDILVTNPELTLITKNNKTIITYQNHSFCSKNNPFCILKEYIRNFNLQFNHNYPIPFQGGFLGVLGYDLSKYIEPIPKLLSKTDIFLPDMAIGLYRWAIIADHKLCKNYLVTHDNPDPILLWINQENHNIKQKKSFQLLTKWKSNINQNEYLKKFRSVKNHLIEGNCYQICLSQRFQAKYIGSEWSAFLHLLNYNQSPFSAFIRLPEKSSILCFSPERFIQLNQSKIKTQPIKGTISTLKNVQNNKNQIKKLLESKKNQSENLMIVDLLRNDLGKVAIPGSIHVSKLFEIKSFPNVHHMISTILGKLDKNFNAVDLLQACFPGGSITGAPKFQSMKLIEELEPNCRNIWSGSIVYFSCCGNMDSNIIIRTLLSEKNQLFCSVGSAIVFESDYKSEYQEMLDKVSTLLQPLLNLVNVNIK